MSRESLRDLLVFSLLLAFGVLGRWAEPAWGFTPLTAMAALGGFYFRSWLPALLLPLCMQATSDYLLQPHDNFWVPLSVYALTPVPVILGRTARNREGWRRAMSCGLCAFAPATLFFIVTNFAVWASRSLYQPTLAGLVECYVKALPFYRISLAGDVCFVTLAVACVAAAQLLERRAAMARA